MDAVAIAQYVFKKLNDFENQAVELLAGGNIKTIEEYRYVMGELSMLRTLRQDLREALQMQGDDFDE
tara:strand:+ start:510 stop:710 length:201 start_codon:yes stop_codon:yes gene_type:complete